MNRTCQCGGIIREAGKAYWDTLPSCTCVSPVMVHPAQIVYTTGTTVLSNKEGE